MAADGKIWHDDMPAPDAATCRMPICSCGRWRWPRRDRMLQKPARNNPTVPRISEFFGLMVYMYWFDTQKHRLPHIHVRYQGSEAVFTLDGVRLEGELGPRAERLVAEWCAERVAELQQAWQCAVTGREIPWVLPLR